MEKIALFLILLVFSSAAVAENNCFIVQENNHVIVKEGNCSARHSPCSTFKIALSLMGYDALILKDQSHPEFPFKEGYTDFRESWKRPQNPTSWIKESCVWYSQVVAGKLGFESFQDYVAKFDYGNLDISDDRNKDPMTTNSWISGSLKISPEEQIKFLQKFVDGKLPVSARAHVMTKKIIFVEDLPNGWKFYGKTGAGDSFGNDGKRNGGQLGWFVGFIEKGNRKIVFVNYLEEPGKQDYLSSRHARDVAKERLIKITNAKK